MSAAAQRVPMGWAELDYRAAGEAVARAALGLARVAARAVAVVLAVLLAMLASREGAAYAHTAKTCAPGTAIPEARDQREGRMAEKKTTRRGNGGKGPASVTPGRPDDAPAMPVKVAIAQRVKEGRYPVAWTSDVDERQWGERELPEVRFPPELNLPALAGVLFDERTGAYIGELTRGRFCVRSERTPLDGPAAARARGRWVTREDAANVRDLLTLVANAVMRGDRARLDRIRSALALLMGDPEGDAKIVEYEAALVSFANSRHLEGPGRMSRTWALATIDPKFEHVTADQLTKTLDRIKGALDRGAAAEVARAACELAESCGAFGSRRGTRAANVRSLLARLRTARNRLSSANT